MAASKSTLDRIVWKAYTEPDFFRALMEAKDSIVKLRVVLTESGFRGVDTLTLIALKQSLNHQLIHATPEEMMTALHKCTKPAQMKGGGSWVLW